MKNRETQDISAMTQAVAARDWRYAETRDERGKLIRQALFRATAELVGELGYQGTSIAMITQRAGIAHGSFYNYFDSRQDAFDQLLPTLGLEMLVYVRDQTNRGATLLEKEEIGFRAFFKYLKENPHFFRILNESIVFAPKAYVAHLELISQGYARRFKRAQDQGELQGYQEKEFEVIAHVLMSGRVYLAWRFLYGVEQADELPEWAVQAYMKLVRDGLKDAPDQPRKPRALRPAK